ncbi:MAG: M23 family metallopeptidase [Bacteroidota bacterium]
MRYYIISATLFTFSALFFATESTESLVDSMFPTSSVAYIPADQGMKVQQAQLRRVNDVDLLESPSIKPVPPEINISSYFGVRLHPVFKRRRMHYGVDFPVDVGTPIVATAGGIVLEAMFDSDSSTFGKHIIIGHDDAHSSLYAHLSRLNVKEGQEVSVGDTIALSGNTGVSTNPHLHYEVLKYGRNMNPIRYFE